MMGIISDIGADIEPSIALDRGHVLTIGKDDVLVICCPEILRDETRKQLEVVLGTRFGVECVVLDGGATPYVITKDEAEAIA